MWGLVIIFLLIVIILVALNNNQSGYGIMSVDGNNYLWNSGTYPMYDSGSLVYLNGRDNVYPVINSYAYPL